MRLAGGKLSSRMDCDEGLQGAAACSLKDAGEQNDAEGWGGSAEEGGDGEDDDAGEQEALASEAAGEPVGGGEDDGVGDEVAGEHPGGFGVGGGEAAGDVGQGHGGDGGVEHLHEGGEHDRAGDQPRIDALGEWISAWASAVVIAARKSRDYMIEAVHGL